MTLEEWIDAVRTELGLGPVDRDVVLDLARDVAHGIARPAAPLTTFLLGLAVGATGDGPDPDAGTVRALADRVLALLPAPADG